jgi:hypothetical protein
MRYMLTFVASVGVIALGACREEVQAPTAPAAAEEKPAFATAAALSFRQVSVGGASSFWEHTCGVTTDNRAYCWGFNERVARLALGRMKGRRNATTGPAAPAQWRSSVGFASIM